MFTVPNPETACVIIAFFAAVTLIVMFVLQYYESKRKWHEIVLDRDNLRTEIKRLKGRRGGGR
jgi:hypothetical protein